ncbi:MAG: autotransporter outer membrane beta-barrel domain-containing protein [Brevundimonas sp.]|nr:MAG: autotransporter outer membrane beta-barrel domain-containing protein [Brevundimonas sp.]
MRILLATAVAIAPLMAASGAMAEVVISTARTTPITTANATGSGADLIRIASGGAVNVSSGAAVTLNSSHGVDIDSGGSITMSNSDNGATGILVNGGNSANVTVGGGITLSDNIANDAALDTDKDGDADGPFANGTGRYGVRVAGPAAFTGNIVVETTGAINLEGNDSYGVAVEAPLNGDLSVFGAVNVIGDRNVAVRTTGVVNGDVQLAGAITARGQNSTGASIESDVTGQVVVHSSITSTGYRFTTAPVTRPEGYQETASNDQEILFLDELDADDLLQGGPALRIAGNVAQGVLLGAGPVYVGGVDGDSDGDGVKNGDEDDDGDGTVNRTDTDRDGDGIPDSQETLPNVTSYGAAPAIQVGSATQSVTLGVVGAGNDAFGFVNRGSINGFGVYSGVTGNGMAVGGLGQAVTLNGGLRNEGQINASSIDANSSALRFGSGATAATVFNSGMINAGHTSQSNVVISTGVQVDAGANVASLTNNGTIFASSAGGVGNATAILDSSGTLTSITNNRSLQALLGNNVDGDAPTGRARAIDVSANTTGVTFTQGSLIDGDDDGDPTTTDPDADGDGVDDSDEAITVGEIRMGSGADVVDIRNGLVLGDIAFGAGADTLNVSGGGIVRGVLSDTDGALAINVTKGTLDGRQTTALNVTSLNVGADGDLIVTVDPAAGAAGGYNVSGTANLATGAGLGLRFNSLLAAPGRFTLIDAGTLNAGTIDTGSITENSPYLYVVEAGTDAAAGQVFADVRRRTAAEAGLIPVESAVYDPFYTAIGTADAADIRNVFLAQTSREEFVNLYEQLLPDHSGGPLLSLASGVDAVTRALTGRNASAAPGETSAWLQEINFYADKDKTDTYGFRSEGFGVAGGLEKGTELGAVGATVAFTSSDLEDPESEAEEVLSASLLEMGLYWRAQGQYWTTWARGAVGYASFTSERKFVGGGLNLSNESDWNGFTLAAAGGASYERTFGRYSIRPEIYGEYFSLNEDGHVEDGGGDGFDLEIDDRQGHLLSATAAINFGMAMGQDSWLKPELRVGWRQNISVDPGETIARFRSGGGDFTLTPDTIEGGGPILGFRLNIGNELGMLSISADAEMIEDYVRYMLFLRASFRF